MWALVLLVLYCKELAPRMKIGFLPWQHPDNLDFREDYAKACVSVRELVQILLGPSFQGDPACRIDWSQFRKLELTMMQCAKVMRKAASSLPEDPSFSRPVHIRYQDFASSFKGAPTTFVDNRPTIWRKVVRDEDYPFFSPNEWDASAPILSL